MCIRDSLLLCLEVRKSNVFEAVKQSITTRQAAEHYGIRVNRNGKCVCPFHNDKNPSMKVDKRFHCFGCQADVYKRQRWGTAEDIKPYVDPAFENNICLLYTSRCV